MTQQLALGTAQFGLDYGVTNTRGRLPQEEAVALLQQAWDGGLRLLDTAQAYGSSEEVLGAAMRHAWQVATKTLPLRTGGIDAEAVERVDAAFAQSLRRLRRPAVDVLLVHNAQDLLAPGGEQLHEWLRRQSEEGRAVRIGVSAYEGGEVAALLDRFSFDVIQLPVSLADQRLVADGTLARVRAAGIEIHARSLFLQGVLLAPAEFVAGRFPAQAAWLRDFEDECARRGVTRQQACLGFFKSREELAVAVAGVAGAGELPPLLAAWAGAPAMDWSGWGVDNTAFTDPRLWKTPS